LDGDEALEAEVRGTAQRILLALPSRDHQVRFQTYVAAATRV
jgi:hypothetical protein